MYLLLIGMVRRASSTIRMQRSELLEHLGELREALDDNRGLQARVSKAAARTTTLNERFLRRVSADIHDGPAQDVSLALLRVEGIAEGFDGNGRGSREDVERLRGALDSALTELRSISHGLRAPSVEDLTPGEAAKRAVTDYERIWGESISFDDEGEFFVSSPSVNITIYRVVQESLANSYKYAQSASRRVEVKGRDSQVEILISDTGPGFELARASSGDTLGLVGMRERVELLGGSFTVTTQPGRGTAVQATLPLVAEAPDA
jgi:signal transduction histidine kinase